MEKFVSKRMVWNDQIRKRKCIYCATFIGFAILIVLALNLKVQIFAFDNLHYVCSYAKENSTRFRNLSRADLKLLKRTLGSSPIVVPKYKLIFFWNEKAGCTYWKTVFQHIQGLNPKYVHNPSKCGLKFLANYADCQIEQMMSDSSWTKAVFIREPRERLLSAFFDKGLNDEIMIVLCGKTVRTFPEFLELTKHCKNDHWTSQVRLPVRFYKEMMIGTMSNINNFTETLLTKLGAWNHNTKKWLSLNQTNNIVRPHASNSKEKLIKYYNYELENYIFTTFSKDYEVFGFDKKHVFSKKKKMHV